MPFTHATETAFQKGQLGIETEYGTAVVAAIALGSVTLNPSPKRFTDKFAARGRLLTTIFGIGREHSEISFEGRATYEELGYFLKSIVSEAQVDPLDEELIYTIEAGGLQIPGGIVSAITIKGNNKTVDISGTMLGKKGTPTAPTAGLTAPDQTPVVAGGVAITIDGTPFAKAFNWELALADIWGVDAYINNTVTTVLQKALNATFKMSHEADDAWIALLSSSDEHEIIITATTGANVLTITFNAKLGEPTPYADEEGIYAMTHNFEIMNKAGNAIEVSIV